ncbi:hypothetical protein CBR_g30949 [Chara braunii]|uniref:Uncharacterized protein n=1 Tax=Chara braunii TaxID=69332 RepID=A0A388LDY9_CHABU|nr:hypothetical protein CBR_g30949 [Chara braunii]|eukprot:GBG80487.1 hypothetical protein CBR_g30949 [Chara braunii]
MAQSLVDPSRPPGHRMTTVLPPVRCLSRSSLSVYGRDGGQAPSSLALSSWHDQPRRCRRRSDDPSRPPGHRMATVLPPVRCYSRSSSSVYGRDGGQVRSSLALSSWHDQRRQCRRSSEYSVYAGQKNDSPKWLSSSKMGNRRPFCFCGHSQGLKRCQQSLSWSMSPLLRRSSQVNVLQTFTVNRVCIRLTGSSERIRKWRNNRRREREG